MSGRPFDPIPPGLSEVPQDLLALLEARAAKHPTRVAVCDLGRDSEPTTERTYEELLREAAGTARQIELLGWAGEPILLATSSPTAFIVSFFGILAASAVPVPVSIGHSARAGERLIHVSTDAGAAGLLVDASLASRAGQVLRGLPDSPPLAILSPRPVKEPQLEPGDRQALALLQYTSGSTSQPRGVRITNANLLHNMACVRQAMGTVEGGVVVSWLPLHHDMGLIGMALFALFGGCTAALMRPVDFVTRPLRWAQAITRHAAQFTGGPNLGLEMLLRVAREKGLEDVDLSSLRAIANGAEPVRPETLEECQRVLGPVGLGQDVIVPCYGLAESTLIASGSTGHRHKILRVSSQELEAGTVSEDPLAEDACELVSCGGPLGGQEILIVDPKTGDRRESGQVGEIWLRGESVSQGYLHGATQTFGQTTSDGRDGCMRTGDLGALVGDDLYITGRLKDLIIVAGRNLHPADIEWVAARAHPALRPGSTAAFGVETEDGELPVMLVEIRGPGPTEEILRKVRAEVTAEFDFSPKEILAVEPGFIPRTTSGKIRRNTCRTLYLSGSIHHPHSDPSTLVRPESRS